MPSWVRFRHADGRTGFGTQDGEQIVEHAGNLFASPTPTRRGVARAQVTLLAPCTPSKIVALWNNFQALAAKLGKAAPSHPLFLLKPATSVVGPGEPIRRPTRYDGRIAFEGELGIVIGKPCRDASPAAAAECILGYTCVNDVTAIDLLNENADFAQWCRAKGSDTFGCVGPAIVTALDWRRARVVTRVDGVVRQDYPLADMIFPPDELVSRISFDMLLAPGDIIACGTSLGVGSIKDGATVAIAIDGIGTLANSLAPRGAAG